MDEAEARECFCSVLNVRTKSLPREAFFIFKTIFTYHIGMLEFLPPRLLSAVQHVNLHTLYELRVRADKPLTGNVSGTFHYLGASGVTARRGAILPTDEEVREIVLAASGRSVYAVENQLRQGFLTGPEGERIGIAGTYVYEDEKVLSVNKITSLCIRIPHAVRGCAEEVYARCFRNGLCSVLVLSPPGEGKTTILRELCRLICERTEKNVLVSDERGELSAGELGDSADVICFADKLTAFTAGIRAMRPDVIVTDELLPADYAAVRRAAEGGIVVLASAHLKRFEDVPDKLFSRYVLLDGLGVVGEILDGEGRHVD